MNHKFFALTEAATLWLIVFASVSIVLPTTFMSVATGLFAIFWLLSANYKEKISRIRSSPAALASIALFAIYAIGTLYSSATWGYSLKFLMKYDKLLLIPLIISVLHSDKHRDYALNAFLFGMIAVLIVSCLMWLGVVPHHENLGQGYYVFKGRIAHNIFMSFTLYLMMHKAFNSAGWQRNIWIILSVLAVLNILYMVNGRTGQITMLVLIFWFIYEVWGIKIIAGCLILSGLVLTTLQINHALPHSRLTDVQQETAGGISTSAGQRLEMYKSTLTLIQRHPIFGGGTGSLENEYYTVAKQEKDKLGRLPNPHNQFLLTTQELGLVGLGMLLAMWASHWQVSYRLTQAQHAYALRGLILTIVVGSAFNSLLLDASEGKFFCILAGILLSSYQPIKSD